MQSLHYSGTLLHCDNFLGVLFAVHYLSASEASVITLGARVRVCMSVFCLCLFLVRERSERYYFGRACACMYVCILSVSVFGNFCIFHMMVRYGGTQFFATFIVSPA